MLGNKDLISFYAFLELDCYVRLLVCVSMHVLFNCQTDLTQT